LIKVNPDKEKYHSKKASVTNQIFLIVKRLAIGRATQSRMSNTQKKLSRTFEQLH
jgi:hypothetical protein|tara:strand:- start:228 stop:392 length:165 start_codon:yes stop_codon:yes gene_type:complete